MEKTLKFQKNSFGKRLGSMLKVDARRMFKSKYFYILIASALIIPILMTVMLTMMDGTETVNQQTGEVTIIHGPENAWQSIGPLPTEEKEGADMAAMDVMSLCNINMMFMLVAVFVGLFISGDFRSGFAKNLFTVRAKRGDYVASKTIAGFACGSLMLLAYFAGAILGGAISGLSFELPGLSIINLVMCMLAKIFLMLVFVAIFVIISIASKQKAWLAICGSMGGGMLLFMMVSMITPLNSTIIHVMLCLAGGALFAVGFGALATRILGKMSVV